MATKKKSTIKALLNDCAPKIWNKMTEDGQNLWVALNAAFYGELKFWDCIDDKTKAIVAHNLACEAVFTAARMGFGAFVPMLKAQRITTRRSPR